MINTQKVSKQIFYSIENIYDQFIENQINLRRLEGTRIAHCGSNKLYIDGQVFSIPLNIQNNNIYNVTESVNSIQSIFGAITQSNRVNSQDFQINKMSKDVKIEFKNLIIQLLKSGYFYPIDQ